MGFGYSRGGGQPLQCKAIPQFPRRSKAGEEAAASLDLVSRDLGFSFESLGLSDF